MLQVATTFARNFTSFEPAIHGDRTRAGEGEGHEAVVDFIIEVLGRLRSALDPRE
jgi:hypothetical protein